MKICTIVIYDHSTHPSPHFLHLFQHSLRTLAFEELFQPPDLRLGHPQAGQVLLLHVFEVGDRVDLQVIVEGAEVMLQLRVH